MPKSHRLEHTAGFACAGWGARAPIKSERIMAKSHRLEHTAASRAPYSGLVYGKSAISRARLMAVVNARCCLAVSPVIRRGMMRPRSVMK
jgi:hypothetical protein